jgi:thiol-disulfide isomerase/thioredoxin
MSLAQDETYQGEQATISDGAMVLPATSDTLKVGNLAPTFVLPDIKTDEPVYLRDFTGKTLRRTANKRHVVVLSFWSTWCEPCKSEIPRLAKLAEGFRDDSIKFFLINTMEYKSTTEDSIRAVYLSRGYSLPSLRDATGRVAKHYNVRTLPVTVVIDKFGIVRRILSGFRENVYLEFAESLRRLAGEGAGDSQK